MPRFTLTFKASNYSNLNNGPQNNSCFFHAASVANAEAIADAIAEVSNGTPVSLTQQIRDYGNPQPPFGDLGLNGGSSRYRCSFISATRRLEQITVPFKKQNVSDETMEALFEDLPVQNREGEDIGQWVKGEPIQRVDGARAATPAAPAGPPVPAGP